MKTYKKKGLIVGILTTISFSIQACNNLDKSTSQNKESSTIETVSIETPTIETPTIEALETKNNDQIESETNSQIENEISPDSELRFDFSQTMTENIDILNSMLETKFGKQFSLSTIEDYEEAGPSDWTIILRDGKVAIDTGTWKYDYDLDSDDSQYMEAILTTFIFFYGQEMGNSLWLLTGDLVDGGADETLYGFKHEGGQANYKNGNSATYEPGNYDNFYIWLTPEDLK